MADVDEVGENVEELGQDQDAADGDDEGQGDVVGPIRVKKTRRHHNRNASVLPVRPKKAATAYSMFLKEHFRTNRRAEGAATTASMAHASAEWKRLDPARRAHFQAQCQEDRDRYAIQILLWKQQKEFVKRPPSSYALFLKDTWVAERQSGRSIAEMGKLAAQRWKGLTQLERDAYKLRCDQLLVEHQGRLQALARGQVTSTPGGLVIQDPNAPALLPVGGPAVAAQGQGQGQLGAGAVAAAGVFDEDEEDDDANFGDDVDMSDEDDGDGDFRDDGDDMRNM